MAEVWLRTNRRALMLGMILPIVLIVVGLVGPIVADLHEIAWVRWLGYALAALGVGLLLLIGLQFRIPRLAYQAGELLVYLRGPVPLRVPVEFVECVFLSAGAGQIPGEQGHQIALRNLVLRIAEKATDYHRREVKAALGKWDEGYITIHGAWCEPLNLQFVQQINNRLAEAHHAASDKAALGG
jgi:hypothetical protein